MVQSRSVDAHFVSGLRWLGFQVRRTMQKTSVRFVVIAFLGAMFLGGCAKAPPKLAVNKWADALRDPESRVRKKAAFKLGNIGRTDRTAVPALIDALKDADAGVRRETILSLVKIGPQANTAIAQLSEVEQHDNDESVRSYATKALAKLR
jgi:HEAT repeat protein